MTIRVAAIEVSHWHALNDAAYLRHLIAMPDVKLVAIQDSDAGLVAKRAAAVGNPPTYTDHRKMLAETKPDFVVALGRHSQMAGIAHDLLDRDIAFLMEKPMGISAAEVEAVAEKAAKRNAFVAVPLAQRYGSFAAGSAWVRCRTCMCGSIDRRRRATANGTAPGCTIPRKPAAAAFAISARTASTCSSTSPARMRGSPALRSAPRRTDTRSRTTGR
jgi:hypothetical protein